MTINKILLIPKKGDPLGLLKGDVKTVCRARRDESWMPWCGDEDEGWCERALVLAWDGERNIKECRHAEAINGSDGIVFRTQATLLWNEQAHNLRYRCENLGKLIFLDHEDCEVKVMIVDVGQRWQHLKRGSLYDIVAVGTMQESVMHSDVFDGEDVVIYRGEDGKHWVRRYDQFIDGRFIMVSREDINGS